MKKLIICLVALAAIFMQSGCATAVALQLKNKLPRFEADELAVQVRWAGVQVGVMEVTGMKFDADGNLTATTFHEDIGTPTGGIVITGKNVKIPQIKP